MNPPRGIRWVRPDDWDAAPQLRLFYSTCLYLMERLNITQFGGS